MRTAVSQQRQGLASRVLAVMAQAAADRGIARAFLQVGAANTKALALYERLGFQRAWAYAYWRRI
jgi:ribosomal protein S18 acetylase RimI-like enzyme